MSNAPKAEFNSVASSQSQLDGQFLDAAWSGKTDLLQSLLKAGANLKAADDYKWNALHRAAHQGHDDTVKALLAAGLDNTAKTNFNNTPSDLARKAGRKSTEKILREFTHGKQATAALKKTAPRL